MKIGIVRHFKVDYKLKRMMNSSDFEEYVKSYDNSPVIENKIHLKDIQWNKCYCSDLKRAIITAKSIYDKTLEITDLLREVKMCPIKKLDLNTNENILIVSHGFFLITLINEFKLLGFKGDIPRKMKNGYLYILEK